MSIYMKADKIQGNVTTKGFENWIALDSLTFGGVSVSLSEIVGKADNRVNNRPSFGEISIVKTTDQSSILLFEYANTQKVIPNVEIDFVSTATPPVVYERIRLTSVLVSSHSFEHHDGIDKTIEYYTLNYGTIERTYTPRSQGNIAESPYITGYNLPNAQKM